MKATRFRTDKKPTTSKDAFSPARTNNLLTDLLYFSLGTTLVLILVWIAAQHSLGWRAASVYLSPLVPVFVKWFIWSLTVGCAIFFLFSWFPALLRQEPSERADNGQHPQPIANGAKPRPRAHPRLLRFLIAAAACFAIAGAILYLVQIGDFVEKASFPGTSHPSLEIRRTGFLQSSLHAFVVGPLYKQKVLFLPLTPPGTPPKPAPVQPQAEIRMARPGLEPYEVAWSREGSRFAVLFKGFYLAAYDLNTGQKVQQLTTPASEIVERFLQGHRAEAGP